MTLLKKPLGHGAAARPAKLRAGQSAGEPCSIPGPSALRPSALAARTAALLQRLRGQQGVVTERQPVSSAAEPGILTASAGADLNRIHLTGHLGSEPLLYDVGDHPVATLALACERRWRAADGRLQLETTWINLSAMEELAEHCGRLLHRDDRVYVEGSLHLWTEVQASQSYACHAVIVERIVLLAAGSVASKRSLGSQ
jgi:single stranded DNA-binding protein